MDLKDKMMKASIRAITDRAIRDISMDTTRGIRKLSDMGNTFARGEGQKHFFNRISDILQKPNCYNKLLKRLISETNPEILKTQAVNLGYQSLTYGVKLLRENEKKLGHHIPWILDFDCAEKCEHLKDSVKKAAELGIFSFSVGVGKEEAVLSNLLSSARDFPECTFFVAISPSLITLKRDFSSVQNVLWAVEIEETREEELDAAFKVLNKQRVLYGFQAEYQKDNLNYLLSDEFLNRMIADGCIFGDYKGIDLQDKKTQRDLYDFVLFSREGRGKELFLFDFYEDIKQIDLFINEKESTFSCREQS